jgi:hypothetical protein
MFYAFKWKTVTVKISYGIVLQLMEGLRLYDMYIREINGSYPAIDLIKINCSYNEM